MSDRFPPNSRYYPTETAELVNTDGRRLVYLRRRFVFFFNDTATTEIYA